MKLLLTTLHAKYIHSSLALPYLAAASRNIPDVRTVVREFTINQHSGHILNAIALERADIVGFSCYIWNIEQTLRLASDLKKIRPSTRVILGGPEVSFNPREVLLHNPAVDCIIRGEGEITLSSFLSELQKNADFDIALKSLKAGVAFRAGFEVIVTPLPDPIENLDMIPSPFTAGLVTTDKPLIYYETSRGCPFSCAFCISSLEQGVRAFSMDRIKEDLYYLMNHRVGTIKLVDRTFNYDGKRANEIWNFIIKNNFTSRFHFEIAADLLSEDNIRVLEKAPAGMFRFEIGVQSGSEETLARVGRNTDVETLMRNVERLRTRTGVVIHLDLIAGLPGDDLNGFFSSLQRLFDVRPHHIQVEPLKVLKGSPMEKIAQCEGYAFSAYPPYTILGTPDLSFAEIRLIEIISRLLDVFFNSGKFRTFLQAVGKREPLSDFFRDISVYIDKGGTLAATSLRGHFELILDFLKSRNVKNLHMLNDALCYDFCLCEYPAAGNTPSFLGSKQFITGKAVKKSDALEDSTIETGSRIRTCVCSFSHDYTTYPWTEGTTQIAFTYISSQGKGLQVKAAAIK